MYLRTELPNTKAKNERAQRITAKTHNYSRKLQ